LALCGATGAATATASAAPAPPTLQARSASLINGRTGQILYGYRAHARRAVASATKLMTVLVTLQHVHRLSTMFTQMNWRPDADDSQIGLVPGERMSVRDLIRALLIPSADDAAMDLAYNVGHHSVARFVAMMNADARRLGLKDTHYSTPSGLDQPGNYSSAYDLVKLARYDLAHYRLIRRVVAMPSATLETGDYVRHVTTTDYLLNRVPWIHGVKTGHTAEAGYVLVSEGQRDGMQLIGAVLGTASEAARDQNALTLLDWGYRHFHRLTLVRRGAVLARVPVRYSHRRVALVAARSYTRMVPRGARIRVVLQTPTKPLVGPLAKGRVVGRAAVEVGGQRVAEVPLVLRRALPKASLMTKISHSLPAGTTLLLLALIVGGGAAAAGCRWALRRRRPRILRTHRVEER
jgi:D-alanyl-D-alanine carboxypeptidase (penicillin-binding protein 5/6)